MGGDAGSCGVMIDRPGSDDRDDAVWVTRESGGWRAWVHIADVARLVPPGATVDVEAYRRGETRYLPDRTIRMLPREVERQAALRSGDTIPTCRIALRVDPDGALGDAVVEPGTLVAPHAASYEEAAAALSDPDHPLHGMLREAHDLARTLLARRRAAGALALYDLLHGWATTEEGGVVALSAPERNAGYVIVQELMIAANEAAARWAVQQDLPILFRNHRPGGATREELAEQLAVVEGPDGAARVETVRAHLAMVLRPAVYEPRVGGHFGLNLPAYTHATSPLRRYPDLVNQRVLLSAATGAASPYRMETLQETATTLNLRREARRARTAAGFRAAADRQTRSRMAGADYRELDDTAFGKLLRLAVAEGRFRQPLADELLRRLDAGRLLPRDAAAPLFEARAPAWQPVRERLLAWLTGEPAHALTLLSLFAQQVQAGAVRWDEAPVGTATQPMFRARARLAERESPARVAPSKRAARQQAALALVAQLADLPDPSADRQPPAQAAPSPERRRTIPAGHPPVSAVNELAQGGELTDLVWEFEAGGSPHEPTHACTVTARLPGAAEQVRATGSGPTKQAAKQAAAAALWRRVDPDRTAPGGPGGAGQE